LTHEVYVLEKNVKKNKIFPPYVSFLVLSNKKHALTKNHPLQYTKLGPSDVFGCSFSYCVFFIDNLRFYYSDKCNCVLWELEESSINN